MTQIPLLDVTEVKKKNNLLSEICMQMFNAGTRLMHALGMQELSLDKGLGVAYIDYLLGEGSG